MLIKGVLVGLSMAVLLNYPHFTWSYAFCSSTCTEQIAVSTQCATIIRSNMFYLMLIIYPGSCK